MQVSAEEFDRSGEKLNAPFRRPFLVKHDDLARQARGKHEEA